MKKCANRYGNCRKKCKPGEVHVQPPTSMCSKQKMCCILSGKELYPLICGNHSKTATTVGVPRTMMTKMRLPQGSATRVAVPTKAPKTTAAATQAAASANS